jgi:tetratricopeptide (TPR) repeat protein
MRRPCLLLIAALAFAAPALADTAPAKPPTLTELYDRLASAKSDDEADGIVRLIGREQLRSGSDTADLLMARALSAIEAKKLDIALEILSAILRQSPDYTEAWNKRSLVYFLKNDYTRSVADIAQTLHREPRHFGAWAGLGAILEATGDKKHAYEAFKHALAVNPHLTAVQKQVDDMKTEVEGRDI